VFFLLFVFFSPHYIVEIIWFETEWFEITETLIAVQEKIILLCHLL